MDNPQALIRELQEIVGKQNVLGDPSERITYRSDAYPLERAQPLCTVLPATTEEVSRIVKLLNERKVNFAPRGAGTGLAGGSLCAGGVLIGVARMNRILEIDLRNRRLTAQAGAVNIMLSKAVAKDGYHYAPDPSSQGASTLGGNIANNSGGPHTLKQGVTVNHLMAVELVLPDGEVVTLGDKTEDVNGYDLLGVVCGGEGTLGVVTQATVRLTPIPPAVRTLLAIFDTVDQATRTVSGVIAAGLMPAALEMMDALILQTVEDAFHFGFPRDAGAILIIELDGMDAGLDRQADQVRAICAENNAREVRQAQDAKQRAELWAARKKAIGTIGRLTPSCVTQDGVIPRSTLPQVLAEIGEIGRRYNLRIANVFHAGDGNLHPAVLFDERDQEEVARVIEANREILELCISVGGALTGEHGIGVEKRDFMPLLFPEASLDAMARLRDVFNPTGLCNPDKVLPTGHGCSYDFAIRKGAVAV
ncbi:MAG TPA: FAD-linked oxidase C-terminal domain-containing protein [Capsulimonadaceae bacterium]|nr:FAD-linked oxidase C-terminal domain-containing protein [Capsulimonadaceae bacterium]